MSLPRRIAAVAFALALCSSCGSDAAQEVKAVTPTTNAAPIVHHPTVAERARALRYLQQVVFVEEVHRQLVAGANYAAGVERATRRAARERTPVEAPRPDPRASGRSSGGSVWDRLASCESGGNWASTAGSFEGGVQFLNSTWLAMGGGQYARHAYDATREQQIAVAERLLARSGWGQWPQCSRRLGLR